YFGGLAIEEVAQALGLSPATVKRDWTMARLFLRRELDAAQVEPH
ncbi:MAG: RNA polymerase subunit sigma, partial [Proteobacteria bacterium]|nr:RNA polymerase subunit sigma [Pseudomonadota bacterium]